MERNPDIKASEESARSKVERIRQVTALPDPFLKMKALPEPTRTAEGDNYFILGVSQKFPVPEKLDRAGRVALEEARIALQRWQATRLRVIADVKRAYFQLYVVDRSVAVTQANQVLVPIKIGTQTGSDVMKRMAAPMFGGLLTSFAMELLIYPAIFLVAKQFEVWRAQRRTQLEALD